MRTTGTLAIATLTITLSTCSSGDNNTDAFCDTMHETQLDLIASNTQDDTAIERIVNALEEVNPPDEIASEFDNVLNVYGRVADGTALTDPELATNLADINSDITTVENYINDNCKPGSAQ